MIQVNRIYLIFNRLVTKKFLVDTSDNYLKTFIFYNMQKQYWCEIYCFMSDI